jgi:hypothetical protein
LVECNLAKVDVAGSNPVSRSIPSENLSHFVVADGLIRTEITMASGPTLELKSVA